MNKYINDLKQRFILENIPLSSPNSQNNTLTISDSFYRLVPADMIDYFEEINGTNGQYDDSFIRWYSLADFQTLEIKFQDWTGIPDYRSIIADIPEKNEYFAFGDYLYHSLTYVIQLNENIATRGKIFALGGDEPILIANSFFEFVKQYLTDSSKLY